MLSIRKIQDGDMEFVRANPFEEQIKFYPELVPPEDSITVIFDGEIVAVGGVLDMWPGVGEVWLMLTKKARKQGIFGLIALQAIENKMDALICEHKLWRAQVKARADFPAAIIMIEAFGFQKEGVMTKYTPDGCDMIMYAKIYDVDIANE